MRITQTIVLTLRESETLFAALPYGTWSKREWLFITARAMMATPTKGATRMKIGVTHKT